MPQLSQSPRTTQTASARVQGLRRRRLRSLSLAGVLAFFVFLPGLGHGQIYRWTDERGTAHFTDNLESVPGDQRGLVGTMDDSLPAPNPSRAVPLEVHESGYVVLARINGEEPVRLILDTGATATVISPAAAQRLGLQVRRDPPVLIRTAGGTVMAGTAEVEKLEVGDRRAGPLQLVVHDAVPGADGLLGMNFLGLFHVELRADEQVLLLTPR